MLTLIRSKTSSLSEAEALLARTSNAIIEQFTETRDVGKKTQTLQKLGLELRIKREDGANTDVSVPEAALPLIISLLSELSRGKQVAVVSTDVEVTTQEAADLMSVSRPYVVGLVDQGKIPSRKIGVRRRMKLHDVLRYIEESGDAASTALDEMVAENQRLGLYP